MKQVIVLLLKWFLRFSKQSRPFQSPFFLSVVIGVSCAGLLYQAILRGMIDIPLLKRYALCHLVAEVSVFLFAIASVSMLLKLAFACWQIRKAQRSEQALSNLVESASGDSPTESATWLEKMWRAQPNAINASWFGQRVASILDRQTSRGTCRHFEDDLKDLSELDADQQHNSYGLVRIVSWAMPMFGFLGTVIGISETLGKMDTKALASGSQEAMNSLTAGLYVAFDTTAVGLVLTMAAMFLMFVVNNVEGRLLSCIDHGVNKRLQGLLCEDDAEPKDIYRVEETVRLVADKFTASVVSLVELQSDIWSRSIDRLQAQWEATSSAATKSSQATLKESLQESLKEHVQLFAKAQSEGISQIDARYQQWQTTLSEQARAIHAHQAELSQQTQLLAELVNQGNQLQQLEDSLQQNIARLTDIDRFHEAAIVLAEGVAVLGTQLERSGYLKPRQLRKIPNPPVSIDEPKRKAA